MPRSGVRKYCATRQVFWSIIKVVAWGFGHDGAHVVALFGEVIFGGVKNFVRFAGVVIGREDDLR